ncbi:hypothetical protein ACKC9G_18110 [Pokkaliibacter sp. CJK22405]|uniref:hypothetical protein n=1 Tax=Pokkaliibacter sp. CJK22405 TaxID=3384615 RepID=UPI003984E84D
MAAREQRDFLRRPADEQQDFLTQTWCDQCMEADLGMTDPQEYKEQGIVFIEGKCTKCGQAVITEIED